MSDTSTRPADLASDGGGRAADTTGRPVFPRRAVITGAQKKRHDRDHAAMKSG